MWQVVRQWLGWLVAAVLAVVTLGLIRRPRKHVPVVPDVGGDEKDRADAHFEVMAKEQRKAETAVRDANSMSPDQVSAEHCRRWKAKSLLVLLVVLPDIAQADDPWRVAHPETGEVGQWLPDDRARDLLAVETSYRHLKSALRECRAGAEELDRSLELNLSLNATLTEALEDQARQVDRLDRWWRSPWLWLGVGTVLGAGTVLYVGGL